MLTLDSILLFSENPKALVAFYTKVFGKNSDWSGGDFYGWKMGTGGIAIGPHDKVKGKNSAPERILLNLATDDVEAEFTRIRGLGATVIKEPYHPGEEPSMWVSTFADPDGNFFQIVSPWEGGKN